MKNYHIHKILHESWHRNYMLHIGILHDQYILDLDCLNFGLYNWNCNKKIFLKEFLLGKISLISKKYLEVTYIADSAEFLSHPQSVPENPWLQIHFPQVKFPLKLQFSLFGSNSHGHEHKLSTFIVRFCKKKYFLLYNFSF